jgi:hypothetical protein
MKRTAENNGVFFTHFFMVSASDRQPLRLYCKYFAKILRAVSVKQFFLPLFELIFRQQPLPPDIAQFLYFIRY